MVGVYSLSTEMLCGQLCKGSLSMPNSMKGGAELCKAGDAVQNLLVQVR